MPPLPAPRLSHAPRTALRWLLRTGRSGSASPDARTVARLRPPLSASFVCPAPSRRRRRRRLGLWGAGPERRVQLARARGPGARGARAGPGLPLGWGAAESAPHCPSPSSRPLSSRPPPPPSLKPRAAWAHLLPPAHLTAQSRVRCSALGCVWLPQALGPEPLGPRPANRTGKTRPWSAPGPALLPHLAARRDKGGLPGAPSARGT